MDSYVKIAFDCLPLRTITRLDVPIDASPKYRARCEKLKRAIETHGSFNSYFLHNANCIFRLTNDDAVGMLEFSFEGAVLTDEKDQQTLRSDLDVELTRETCDWITEPVVAWFRQTVSRAVEVEFNRFIAAGDLTKAVERIERIQSQSDQHGGYVGMYL